MIGESVLLPFNLYTTLLLLLGAGFLVMNIRLVLDFIKYLRRRSSALLTWPGPKPRYYGLLLAIGVTLGVLVFYKRLVLHWPATYLFGESMMFVYYAYMLPLSLRIGRGFYEDGIWADSGFIPYQHIGGISWREGQEVQLLLMSRLKNIARRLVVPSAHYAAARRLLRDKIAAHDVHFAGVGLDLGTGDDKDRV